MNDAAEIAVIVLAIALANLPFVNQRVFGVVPMNVDAGGCKPSWLRGVELAVCYALVVLSARFIENRLGSTASQNWQFYAVTVCLFIVAAYPGYVWRYLRRRVPR